MQTNIYSHKLPNQEKWIRLTVKEANCLFAFYVFMLILSSGWLFYSLIYHFDLSENGFSIILGILMFSCSGGLLGSTIYYIRKLYKEFKNLPYEHGAAIGYSMITNDMKTIEDSINESVEDMRTKKEELEEG